MWAKLGERWRHAPHPAFHTLAKDISLNRSATQLNTWAKGHALSHPSYYKYTCAPLSKFPSCAPVSKNVIISLNVNLVDGVSECVGPSLPVWLADHFAVVFNNRYTLNRRYSNW